MKIAPILFGLAQVAVFGVSALAAGLAQNENFVVLAPDQTMAQDLLVSADAFRAQISQEWLGDVLPPSIGATIIHFEISDKDDSGLTWAIDTPDRKYHKLWLTTSLDRARGSTLRHEMTHIVLATRYPERLPAWADEGAASQQDDAVRFAARRRIIEWYASTGNWPSIDQVLRMSTIISSDQASYSTAASITEYLLAQHDRACFLAFAMNGKAHGWNQALQQSYGIASTRELQSRWQTWAVQAVAK